MKFFATLCAILFSILSVIIMSYISMATPIGPWIETTIVLLAIIVFYFSRQNFAQSVSLTTAAAGIGGILATGFGFSLPALYFTNPFEFKAWLEQPGYFYTLLTSMALAAGGFGYVLADIFDKRLIVEQKLPFPIGELIYKTIFADNRLRQALELFIGFLGIQLLYFINWFFLRIQSTIVMLNKVQWAFLTVPEIAVPLEQLPVYLSVGFVTGHVIAKPLIWGFLIKFFCVDPLYYLYAHPQLSVSQIMFPFGFTPISFTEFTLAFCSGIVLYGAVIPFIDMIKQLIKNRSKVGTSTFTSLIDKQRALFTLATSFLTRGHLIKLIIMLIINVALLWHLNFSVLSMLFILIFSAICVYQMLIIAGQIGIVPLGRFATFVMVPGMLLFGFNALQSIYVATFVEVSGGVAADVLFGRRLAMLGDVSKTRIQIFQIIGLLTSCLVIGLVFWLFAQSFGFGDCGLPVVKAASRGLLINIKSFNVYVLFLGFILGFFLKFTKVNSALLLGGILMPPSISLMLIAGGLLSFIPKNKEAYYPLLSGVSAGSVIWILIKAIAYMGETVARCQ